jgi:DNA-binding response OmpR family regulator
VAAEVTLPAGYSVTWGGQFENQQRAMGRLKVIVPITLGRSSRCCSGPSSDIRPALLVLAMVPFTLIGGFAGLAVAGLHLSVSAAVGFIAVAGISVQNGVIMVEQVMEIARRGATRTEAILDGAMLRLRPIVMTALMAGLGLLPAALSHGIGSETQRPFAVVIVGGIVSATVFTLLLLPVLLSFGGRRTAAGGGNAGKASARTAITRQAPPCASSSSKTTPCWPTVSRSYCARRLHRRLRGQRRGRAGRRKFDLLVLDIGLPGMDGLELLSRLRSRHNPVHVLMLTARDALNERVRGLNLGADDYLTKPFAAVELLARVNALARRSRGQGSARREFGPLALDEEAHRAWLDGQPLELPQREWAILTFLLDNLERVLSKERIVAAVCSWDEDMSENAVEVYVSRLRTKLEPAGIRIRTVRGLGYMLEDMPHDAKPA